MEEVEGVETEMKCLNYGSDGAFAVEMPFQHLLKLVELLLKLDEQSELPVFANDVLAIVCAFYRCSP